MEKVKRFSIRSYQLADLIDCCLEFLHDPSLRKIQRVVRQYKKLVS
jgi:hypothetical protein